MPLILVSVAKITGGGSSDKTFSPAIKAAISTEFMKLRPPVSLTESDADTAAIIEFQVGVGNNMFVEKWQLSITLNQLITAINAVESTSAEDTLAASLSAIAALTPAATKMVRYTSGSAAELVVVQDGWIDAMRQTPGADKLVTWSDADNAAFITMGASGKAILQAANAAALKAAGVQTTSEKGLASGYAAVDSSSRIIHPNASALIVSVLSAANDTATRVRTFRDATGEIAVQVRGAATLVAGSVTLDAGNLGAAVAALIKTDSQIRINGISALNATPSLGVHYVVTIVAATSIKIDMYDEAGVADIADVSTRYYEISF